jgi:starch synthase
MSSKLRVIFISAEVAPFAKSGEMADVASALPKYLSYLGMEVSVFREYSSEALVEAVKRALRCYKEPKMWKSVMRNGFSEDFSWKQAAKRYAKLYERSIEIKRGG